MTVRKAWVEGRKMTSYLPIAATFGVKFKCWLAVFKFHFVLIFMLVFIFVQFRKLLKDSYVKMSVVFVKNCIMNFERKVNVLSWFSFLTIAQGKWFPLRYLFLFQVMMGFFSSDKSLHHLLKCSSLPIKKCFNLILTLKYINYPLMMK